MNLSPLIRAFSRRTAPGHTRALRRTPRMSIWVFAQSSLALAGALAAWSAPAAGLPLPLPAAIPVEVLEKIRTQAQADCMRQAAQKPEAERPQHIRHCAQERQQAFQARLSQCEQEAAQQSTEQRPRFMRQCLSARPSEVPAKPQ